MRKIELSISVITLLLATCGVVVGQAPASTQELIQQGAKFINTKEYDKALETFQQAVKLDPTSAAAQAGIGATLIGMSRNADAVEALKAAIALDPKYATAHVNLGIAYMNLRRFDESIAALEEGAKLNPTNDRILSLLGQAAGNAGKFEESIGYFKRGHAINPRDLAHVNNIGITYKRMKRWAEAAEQFKQTVQKDPTLTDAWFNLGVVTNRLGKYSEAEAAFTKVLEQKPDNRDALINRSQTYIYLGGHGREAAQDAQKFLKTYGYRAFRAPYQTLIAIIGLRDAGLEKEAQTVIVEGQKKIEPGHWVHSILQFFNGEISGEELLKLAKNNDQRTEAHVYFGLQLKQRGSTTEARSHFQWAKEFGNGEFVEYTVAIAELGRQP